MGLLSCKQVTETASRHLDGECSRRERLGLWLHLLICVHCRRYLAQFAATIGLLRALPEEAPDRAALAGVLAAFRQKVGPGGTGGA
jgi:predicted anti-sigma-YlaC factor YlaD